MKNFFRNLQEATWKYLGGAILLLLVLHLLVGAFFIILREVFWVLLTAFPTTHLHTNPLHGTPKPYASQGYKVFLRSHQQKLTPRWMNIYFIEDHPPKWAESCHDFCVLSFFLMVGYSWIIAPSFCCSPFRSYNPTTYSNFGFALQFIKSCGHYVIKPDGIRKSLSSRTKSLETSSPFLPLLTYLQSYLQHFAWRTLVKLSNAATPKSVTFIQII